MTSLLVFRLSISFALISLVVSQTVTKTSTVSAPTTPLSASYTDLPTFKSKVLNSTNVFRSEHNASSLTWNDTLADIAQAWASQCHWRHSGGAPGENLALGYENTTAAVDAWGFEREHYDFNKPGFSEETGHFTQLVWKNTTTVGCAYKDCTGINKLEGVLLTCEYWAPGNVDVQGSSDEWSEYRENVQKQIKGAKGGGSGGQSGGTVVSPWRSLVVTGYAVLVALAIS